MPVPQMAHQVSISVFVRVGRILLISFLIVFTVTRVLITDVIELKECLNQLLVGDKRCNIWCLAAMLSKLINAINYC